MSSGTEFICCIESSAIEMVAVQKYCPPCDVNSGLNISASDVLEPDINVVSGCRGFPSLSVQEVATTTLSLSPATMILVHVIVKFSPARELPSLTIEMVGSGNAVMESR